MALVSKTFSQIITFTRASTATYFDSAGVLQSAAIDVPRFDYNPATLAARGFLIEEARTNSIRNNTMQGAVAGTPGTLPTNWIAQSVGGVALTEVVGTGTENGITYIDLRYTGTTSSTAAGGIFTESSTQITAASGQTWTSSFYIRLVGGSTSGITDIFNAIQERDAAGVLLAQTNTPISPTGAALNTQRPDTTRLLTNASTARITQQIRLVPASGVAIDITLRIGLPQLELGAFETSVIPTTTTALTRSADVASVNTLSPWFNVVEGSFVTEWVVSALGVDNNIASLSDGTTNNRYQNYVSNTNAVLVRTAASGVASNNSNGTAVANAIGKFAFGYGSGTTAASFNGSAVTTTTQALPSSISTLYLGQGAAGGGQKQIWLRRYTFYPRKLSNAELQAITA